MDRRRRQFQYAMKPIQDVSATMCLHSGFRHFRFAKDTTVVILFEAKIDSVFGKISEVKRNADDQITDDI